VDLRDPRERWAERLRAAAACALRLAELRELCIRRGGVGAPEPPSALTVQPPPLYSLSLSTATALIAREALIICPTCRAVSAATMASPLAWKEPATLQPPRTGLAAALDPAPAAIVLDQAGSQPPTHPTKGTTSTTPPGGEAGAAGEAACLPGAGDGRNRCDFQKKN
jgi:hypothetical protein